MSEVVEPVYVSPTVVKGVDELMRDYSGHVRLLVDVVLTQDNLEKKKNIINQITHNFLVSEFLI